MEVREKLPNTISLIFKKLNLDIFVRILFLIQTFGLVWIVGLGTYGEYALWLSTIIFIASLILGITGAGSTIYISGSTTKGISLLIKVGKHAKEVIIGYVGINILLVFLIFIVETDLLFLILSTNVFVFYISSGIFLAIFRGLLRIHEIARIEGLAQIIGTLLILILSYFLGFFGIIIATLLIYILKTILYSIKLKNHLISPDDSKKEVNMKLALKEIYTMGLPYGISSVIASTTIWFGLVTLTILFSPSEAGVFNVAMNLFSVLTFLTGATGFVLLPDVLTKDKETSSLDLKIFNTLIISTTLMGAITSVIFYFYDVPEILLVSFEGIDRILVSFFWLVIFSPVTLGLVTIFAEVFKGVYPNRRTTIFFEIMYGIIFFLCIITFIPNLGAVGLSISYSISNFLWFVSVVPFWKKNRKDRKNLLNISRLFFQSGLFIIVEIVTFIFMQVSSITERILFFPLFSLIIIALFFLFLPKDIRKRILTQVKNRRMDLQWKLN